MAAGSDAGGYSDLHEAVRRMGGVKERTYSPDPTAHERYTQMFAEWMRLHDYFGRGQNPVLKKLRAWRSG